MSDNRTPETTDSPERSIIIFFAVVTLLAVPFWIIGHQKLPLPVNLPVSALTAFLPVIAAAILSFRNSGMTGVRRLLARAVDFQRVKDKRWLVVALVLPVLIYSASYVVMRAVGRPLPDQIEITLAAVPVYLVLYLFSGAGEELGWTAYATDPLLSRWGLVRTGLVLGLMWAAWHTIGFIQTGSPADWVLWQMFKTLAMRVLIVWLYASSGSSTAAAILLHGVDNVAWSTFPNNGSHYDPMVISLLTAVAAAVGLMTSGSGDRRAVSI